MTLAELGRSGKEFVSVSDIAEIMECDPQRLRDALDIDLERPMEMRQFLFPHCKVGNRHRIARAGFIRWLLGDLNPATEAQRIKEGGTP